MAGQQRRLDIRQFPAATLDSRRVAPAFVGDLLERPSITIQGRLLPFNACQRWTMTSTYFGSSSSP
jgi:hypothetical protein